MAGTSTSSSISPQMMSANFKVVLLGEGRVGKTSLVVRYMKNEFTETQPPTIQAAFLSKRMIVDGHRVTLNIWVSISLQSGFFFSAVAFVHLANYYINLCSFVFEPCTCIFDETILSTLSHIFSMYLNVLMEEVTMTSSQSMHFTNAVVSLSHYAYKRIRQDRSASVRSHQVSEAFF